MPNKLLTTWSTLFLKTLRRNPPDERAL